MKDLSIHVLSHSSTMILLFLSIKILDMNGPSVLRARKHGFAAVGPVGTPRGSSPQARGPRPPSPARSLRSPAPALVTRSMGRIHQPCDGPGVEKINHIVRERATICVAADLFRDFYIYIYSGCSCFVWASKMLYFTAFSGEIDVFYTSPSTSPASPINCG